MKKTIIVTMVFLLAVGGAYLAADEMGWHKEGKAEAGKPMMGMCPMHTMMCEHMMKKEIIAAGDGGVVILACNKLYKYDKDLNLVKDVELKKIDDDTKAKMEEMKKECAEKCQMKMPEKPSEPAKTGGM
ncbi:MAG: hypothetical protein WAK60_12330 [Sedimentisphaerales bacterium]